MLAQLKFVQGAVSRKDLIPGMTHFAIENGTVRSFNGTLALCAPLPFNIDCKPKAAPLIYAISNCLETVALAMTPTGRLSIKSGAFRAYIDCIQDETPHVSPEGERVDFDGDAMLAGLKILYPFIGEDASRPWCMGALMRGQSVYATNNVILVEYWTGATMPIVVNIPRMAIREMIRIDEPPTYAQVTQNSMTFHYSDGRWIRTQLLDIAWPDLEPLLSKENQSVTIDNRIFEGLEAIKPFADKLGRVFLETGVISTTNEQGEGASFDIPELNLKGIYQIEMLKLLNGVAQHIDFTGYPGPCIFYGERLRGAIIGMRL